MVEKEKKLEERIKEITDEHNKKLNEAIERAREGEPINLTELLKAKEEALEKIKIEETREALADLGWELGFVYTQRQAIEDGVLVYVGDIGKDKVVFSRGLFDEGYEDQERREALVKKGLELLREDDPEDTEGRKLRVIEKGKIWVIWQAGEGITFLRPEDY